MAVFVKMLVERPRHAATVNGLNRYAALMKMLGKRSFPLDETKSLVETASPESAIVPIAPAFKRSRSVYITALPTFEAEIGRSENIGKRRGACCFTLLDGPSRRDNVKGVIPGGIRRHHTGRHDDCRGKDLRVLYLNQQIIQ